MKSNTKKFIYHVTALVVLIFVAFGVLWGSGSVAPVAYADDTYLQMDDTAVLDDLNGVTVNGKPFSTSDYGANPLKKTQLLTFVEYSYSYYGNLRGNYALYLYVWNPKKIDYVELSMLNKANIRFGGDESASYTKYPLVFLNGSEDGLYLKFRVSLTAEDKETIFKTLDSAKRIYEISEVELLENGKANATSTTVGMKYTYTGYAAGFGEQTGAASTIGCIVEESVVIESEVHPTVYRPEGTNGTEYTQDSLHSVYFSIPREIVEEYGYMTAVHATWLNAVLAPVLVTGDKEAYDAILPYLGQDVGTNMADLKHAYAGGANYTVTDWAGATALYGWDSLYAFNLPDSWGSVGGGVVNKTDRKVSPLYWLFYSGDGENSADDYVVRSEDIHQQLAALTEVYGGSLVDNRYSSVLFDRWDDSYTEVNIHADESYSLTGEVLGDSWWDKLWGISHTNTFDGIKAIYEVTDDDFIKRSGELDIQDTCERLYISECDFEEFQDYYEANKEDRVVYLFRYQVTDYISVTANHFVPDSGLGEMAGAWNSEDTNAFIFQETVNLNFDVIDVTCTKDGVSTVIGVASDPIDVIGHGTPPVETEPDPDGGMPDWLKWVLAILCLIVLILILIPLFPVLGGVLKAVWWVIALPFKALFALFKAIGSLFKRDKNKKKE